MNYPDVWNLPNFKNFNIYIFYNNKKINVIRIFKKYIYSNYIEDNKVMPEFQKLLF